ncbi:hypothetical protein ACWEMN_53275, partial [Streptomyces mirabilis]
MRNSIRPRPQTPTPTNQPALPALPALPTQRVHPMTAHPHSPHPHTHVTGTDPDRSRGRGRREGFRQGASAFFARERTVGGPAGETRLSDEPPDPQDTRASGPRRAVAFTGGTDAGDRRPGGRLRPSVRAGADEPVARSTQTCIGPRQTVVLGLFPRWVTQTAADALQPRGMLRGPCPPPGTGVPARIRFPDRRGIRLAVSAWPPRGPAR